MKYVASLCKPRKHTGDSPWIKFTPTSYRDEEDQWNLKPVNLFVRKFLLHLHEQTEHQLIQHSNDSRTKRSHGP